MKLNIPSNELSLEKKNLYLALILSLAAFTRLFKIGSYSMWFDEAASWHLAHFPVAKIIELAKIDNPTPVYHILLRFWLNITGAESDFTVKIPAIIFGILTVYMTYKIGKFLFGTEIALLAAFLGAISFTGIQYSQANRMYSLQMLLASISIYYYLKGMHYGKPGYWIIWLLSSVLAYYNHLFAVFLFVVQWVYFILNIRRFGNRWKPWIAANLILLTMCLCWLPVIFRQMQEISLNYWVPPISLTEVFKVSACLTAGTALNYNMTLLSLVVLPFFFLLVLGAIALISTKSAERLFTPILIFVPTGIVLLYSIGRNSLLHYRYFLYITPLIQITMALGIYQLINKKLRFVIFTVFMASSIYLLAGYYTVSEYSEPMRIPVIPVSKYIKMNAGDGEVIIHQAVNEVGIESYYVSRRYNLGRYREYLWRDMELPFYFGMQFLTEGDKIANLDMFSVEDKIWIITVLPNYTLNDQGLPLLKKREYQTQFNTKIEPDDIWTQAAGLGMKLKSIRKFGLIFVCEFEKTEAEKSVGSE